LRHAGFGLGAEFSPDRARYAYVYAVGLHSAGRNDEAMDILKRALDQHPGDRDVLLALVTFNRDGGNLAAAITYAEKAVELAPVRQKTAGYMPARASSRRRILLRAKT
jgi:tetratricopeptide (TPR) repeat protein